MLALVSVIEPLVIVPPLVRYTPKLDDPTMVDVPVARMVPKLLTAAAVPFI
jgi:hypothetical protein